MDGPQVPNEMAPVTLVSDVDSVGLHCRGEGSRHATTFVWVADSTVMRKWI